MGNTFCATRKAASEKHRKIVRAKKLDGKIPEFMVKEMLEKNELQQHLPPTHELELGHMHHLLRAPVLAPKIGPETESMVAKQASCRIKRIKVVITKQLLQELVLNQISVQDIIRAKEAETYSPKGPFTNTYWRPTLQSIPDENGSMANTRSYNTSVRS